MSSILYLILCLVSLLDLKLSLEFVSSFVMYLLLYSHASGMLGFLVIGFVKLWDETQSLQLTINGVFALK